MIENFHYDLNDTSFYWRHSTSFFFCYNYLFYFSFWNIHVKALAVKLTQKEGELIQEKFEVKKLANFLNQVNSWLSSFWLCVCFWFFMIHHVFWMEGCNLKNSKCKHKSIIFFSFYCFFYLVWNCSWFFSIVKSLQFEFLCFVDNIFFSII